MRTPIWIVLKYNGSIYAVESDGCMDAALPEATGPFASEITAARWAENQRWEEFTVLQLKEA